MERKISIIGCGGVGRALGRALHQNGWRIAALASRTKTSAKAAREFVGDGVVSSAVGAAQSGDIVFITTPDSVIESVCAGLAEGEAFRGGQVVLHCSGGLTSEALAKARSLGASIGSLHPLQSFAGRDQASPGLSGIAFTFEGQVAARNAAAKMVHSLDARLYVITADVKSLYHAASVMASNYVVALADMAATLVSQCRIPSKEALPALMPLIHGTVSNLEQLGLPDALTGPIARGDLVTVEKHTEALRETAPEMLAVYCHLGLRTVDVARFKGRISPEQADRISSRLRAALGSD
jgi:predicted short-subunit dehydrogenase-like oxidoreductase (DUF2520 family)